MEKQSSLKNKFSIMIASVPELDYPVAEVWLGESIVAEIRYEKGFQIQLCPAPGGKTWDFPFDELIDILQEAKEGLGAPVETMN